MTGISHLPVLAMLNRSSVQASGSAGCFACGATFAPSEVSSYTDAGRTCVCPRCGNDCVIGDQSGFPISEKSLADARKAIFG